MDAKRHTIEIVSTRLEWLLIAALFITDKN